jgi:hypothetical protein
MFAILARVYCSVLINLVGIRKMALQSPMSAILDAHVLIVLFDIWLGLYNVCSCCMIALMVQMNVFLVNAHHCALWVRYAHIFPSRFKAGEGGWHIMVSYLAVIQ